MEGTVFTYINSRYLTHERGGGFPPPPSLTFPYSAMWFGHDCQRTWQNMEMDAEQFRNLQESERYNRYVSGTKSTITVISTHSEGLLRKSILRIHTFTSAFNIVWMKPYRCSRVLMTVFCKLWTNPLINLKFYAKQRFSFTRAFYWYTAIPTLEFMRLSL